MEGIYTGSIITPLEHLKKDDKFKIEQVVRALKSTVAAIVKETN
jgi:hypothetical protein